MNWAKIRWFSNHLFSLKTKYTESHFEIALFVVVEFLSISTKFSGFELTTVSFEMQNPSKFTLFSLDSQSK